MQQSGLVVS
jgi:hypothetical protein